MRSEASKQQQNDYHKKQKAERVAQGVCTRCGGSPLAESSTIFCQRCVDLRRKDARDWYQENKEAGKRYSRNWREKNLASGMCADCGKFPHEPGRQRCSQCLQKSRGREDHKPRQQILRMEVFNHYGGAICKCCGETMFFALSLDHIENNGAAERRMLREQGISSGIRFYSWLKRSGFPEGYQVFCMNCNVAKYRNNGICPHEEAKER